MKKRGQNSVLSWIQIVAGLCFGAFAYRMYLIPNDIAPGGFTGIGQLVNHYTGWPVGLITLALNVPLFALSMRSMGMQFGLKSMFASFGLSLSIDHFTFIHQVTTDPLLSAVFGGVMAGGAFGLILRGGATTGGSDMLGTLVHQRVPVLRISIITFAIDACVIIASGFVFDVTKAMYALIASFLLTQMLDMVLEGPNSAKAYYIISGKSEQIAARLMTELDRGVTALQGVGMYSRDEKVVLLCVINRLETMKIRSIVSELDPQAFMIATNVHEALGEGFKPHK